MINQLTNYLNHVLPPAIKDGKTDEDLIGKRILKIALTMLGSVGLSLAHVAAGYVRTGVSIAVIGVTLPAIAMIAYPYFEAWRTKDHESRRFGVEIKPFSKLADATASDFTLSFPNETILEVLSYLDDRELAKFQQVNKQCKVLASEESLWNAVTPKIAFGKKQWATYFGDIGKAAPLPKGIHKILKSPCPFWPGKKVEETHMLVLIPEAVNGKPLNLNNLGELVKAPKEGHATQYQFIWDAIINEQGNQATTKSHWVLMTKDVIEGSRNKKYADQQTLIAEFAKKTETNYEVPNVLDATIGIFMHYIRFGEHLFNVDNNLWAYTRCQEKAEDFQIVIVGGFVSAGLNVRNGNYDCDSIGVAALRKFF